MEILLELRPSFEEQAIFISEESLLCDVKDLLSNN
jgi:hypothetical protein